MSTLKMKIGYIYNYLGRAFPDKLYLSLKYWMCTGQRLNWDNPQTFSEKLQWLKIHDRNPEYTRMVDKYLVKQYVAEKIGPEAVVPMLGHWNHFEDIDFDSLPDRFVLKCTHNSGGLIICKDKRLLNKEQAKKLFDKQLKRNYYYNGREWPYKNVKPQIIAEEYLENGEEGLHDYKIWCFNGEPLYTQFITGRIGKQTYEGFFDKDWVMQEFCYHNPLMKEPIKRPEAMDFVLDAAGKLSAGTRFARIDFYILNSGEVKFGEITFYPMSGMESWKPESTDLYMGKLIDIV